MKITIVSLQKAFEFVGRIVLSLCLTSYITNNQLDLTVLIQVYILKIQTLNILYGK